MYQEETARKTARAPLRRHMETTGGPEKEAKVSASRKAFGEYLFSTIGYCELCASPMCEFDRFILDMGQHLCFECFMEHEEARHVEEARNQALQTGQSSPGGEEMIREFEQLYRGVEDWDFYALDLGLEENTIVLGKWKLKTNHGLDLFFAYECGNKWLLFLQESFISQAELPDLDELGPILQATFRACAKHLSMYSTK